MDSVCICICVCVCVHKYIYMSIHWFDRTETLFYLAPKASRLCQLGWYSQALTRQLSFCLLVTVRVSYSACKEYGKLEAVSCILGEQFTNTRKYFKKQDPFLRGREYPENRDAGHPIKKSVVRILDDSYREGRLNLWTCTFVSCILEKQTDRQTDRQTDTHTHTHTHTLST